MTIARKLVVLLLLSSFLVAVLPRAETIPPATLPSSLRFLLTPPPPNIKAKAYLLMDTYSGKVLANRNIDQRLAPASLTKMMTAYVISSALKSGQLHLNDLVSISQAAWQTSGSKMFVNVGSRVSVRSLLQGIIVASGNDACVAMAEYVAGSQESFVDMMNQQAKRLGMTGSHFVDVSGLPHPNHYSTARDMAILARALILDFPEDYQWYAQKWFTFNGIKQPNRNRLLWYNLNVDGIKTGHTSEAGFCLVASAKQGNMRLISVVLGAPSEQVRTQGSRKLLTYGFRFFETRKLYQANTPLAEPMVYFGSQARAPIGVRQDYYLTFPIGQYSNIKIAILLATTPLKAPLQEGQIVAQLQLSLDGKIVGLAPLVALQSVPEGNFWYRLLDRISLFFYKT